MKKIKIKGNKPLNGNVTISGAKNSTVALIPAAIIADTPTHLEGVPNISDVQSLIDILSDMHVNAGFENHVLTIDPTEMVSIPMPTGKINSLRASYYFMGALLAKYGEAVVGLPGGCDLGPRPIDQHIKGFEALGVEVSNEQGAMYLRTSEKGLIGARIYMDVVSVGATINIMLAAVKAKGETVIENAAREPEIIDVATLLNNMGAKIRGVGTDTIRIEGVDHLHGTAHTIIPDRIEAGTYIIIGAGMGRDVLIKNVIVEHIEALIAKLEELGIPMDIGEDSIRIRRPDVIGHTDIKTQPYPGFATDLQQLITPLLLAGEGESTVTDTIYPKRIRHIPELKRMGGDIHLENKTIFINGPKQLQGTEVHATDLRAGAGLVIAGILAEGETEITGVENILRGYDHIVERLRALGADIEMVEE